jgi:hypothetical protein
LCHAMKSMLGVRRMTIRGLISVPVSLYGS